MLETGRKFSGALLALHAQTALHPGAGTALGTVDLPVQRERHTHWPTIAGSALKGILRDACRERIVRDKRLDDEPLDPGDPNRPRRTRRDRANEDQELVDVFGPPTNAATEAAGALSVTDARLLAFPVRSLKGVFAWVSCPAVLDRLARDAALADLPTLGDVPDVTDNQAVLASAGCACLVGNALVLEEFEFGKAPQGDAGPIADWIARHMLPDIPSYGGTRQRFPKHFAILSDNDFTHFARHATEVMARIGLNYETKTVKEGALFYQEFLPSETLLYAILLANAARARFATRDAPAILKAVTDYLPPVLQIGGDETTGKGYCATRLTAAAGGKS
jgi:CRISPR-associated protein Cmr4